MDRGTPAIGASAVARVKSQRLKDCAADYVKGSEGVASVRRTSRVIHIALRRAKYIARFVLWTVRHRSTKHVRWVLAFEGVTW